MPRSSDSGQLDLADIFLRVQARMLADLTIGRVFEHPSASGTASEQIWIDLFSQYLPKRYRAAPAFVINAAGRRSRQIDIAIFDNFHSNPLFPHSSGDHIPVESVYAIFEVKPTISKQWLTDAADKAFSVRSLQSTNRKILSGLLATSSVWKSQTFSNNLRRALRSLPRSHKIDFGCALEHGAFEHHRTLSVSASNQTLLFFLLRLTARLNSSPQIRAANLLNYLRRVRPQ